MSETTGKDGLLDGFNLNDGCFVASLSGDNVWMAVDISELGFHIDYVTEIAVKLLQLVDTVRQREKS